MKQFVISIALVWSAFIVGCSDVGFSSLSSIGSSKTQSQESAPVADEYGGQVPQPGSETGNPIIKACEEKGSYSIKNNALVYQDDATNKYSLVQLGGVNYADVTQHGSNNTADVVQCGQYNSASITQMGGGPNGGQNSASITQFASAGSGNMANSQFSEAHCVCEADKYCRANPNSHFCQSL